jgi:hypothetical protein
MSCGARRDLALESDVPGGSGKPRFRLYIYIAKKSVTGTPLEVPASTPVSRYRTVMATIYRRTVLATRSSIYRRTVMASNGIAG